jgi:hypothetical protein
MSTKALMELKPIEVVAFARTFKKMEESLDARSKVEVGIYKVKCSVDFNADISIEEDGETSAENTIKWKLLALTLMEHLPLKELGVLLEGNYATREITSFSDDVQRIYKHLANPRKDPKKGSVKVVQYEAVKKSNGTRKV